MERSGLEWENLGIPPGEKRVLDLSMYSSNSSSSNDEFGKLGYNLHSSYYDVVMREPSLTGLRLGRHKEFGAAAVSSVPVSAVVPVAKRSRASYQSMQNPCCQVDGCNLELKLAKDYHRRHRICETHSKSPKVIVAGMERRFCQQCSRFHELSEFDDKKRSCRRRLSDHNARRRRVQPESVAHHPLASPVMPQASSVYDQGSQNVLLNGLPVSLPNSSWEDTNTTSMLRQGQGRDSSNEVHIARVVLDQCKRTSNSTAVEDAISAQSLLSSNHSWSMNEGESASSMEGLMINNNNHHHLTLLESNNINPAAGGGPLPVPLVHSINLQDSDSSHLQEFHLFYDPPRFYPAPRNLL